MSNIFRYLFSGNLNFLKVHLICLLSIEIFLSQWTLTAQPGLKYHAKGTGRTTGHIADLWVYNPDSTFVKVDIGQCFIPSESRHQAYIVPEIMQITVPPFRSINMALKGYCVSIDRSPAFSGQILPPVDQWVNWHSGYPLPEQGKPLSAVFKPYLPKMPGEDNFFLNWPNSADPFYYTLDINEFPYDAVRLLLYFEYAARSSLERLIASGAVKADDQLKDNYIQHVLWLYVSVLEGKTYPKDQFIAKYVRQWEITNNLPANKMEPVELTSAEDIWSNIQLIGAEAKLVKVVVPAYQPAFKQEKTGESIPARSSIIHLINSTDVRDTGAGKTLLPVLLFLNEQKSQPEWYSVWLMAEAELNKWLNHTLRDHTTKNPSDLDKLVNLLAFITDDCKTLIGPDDQNSYRSTINSLLESGLEYLVESLSIADKNYLQKEKFWKITAIQIGTLHVAVKQIL